MQAFRRACPLRRACHKISGVRPSTASRSRTASSLSRMMVKMLLQLRQASPCVSMLLLPHSNPKNKKLLSSPQRLSAVRSRALRSADLNAEVSRTPRGPRSAAQAARRQAPGRAGGADAESSSLAIGIDAPSAAIATRIARHRHRPPGCRPNGAGRCRADDRSTARRWVGRALAHRFGQVARPGRWADRIQAR